MNFYEILHIAENAPDEIIKLAYKGLAQKYHPDRYKGTDANQKMVQIGVLGILPPYIAKTSEAPVCRGL